MARGIFACAQKGTTTDKDKIRKEGKGSTVSARAFATGWDIEGRTGGDARKGVQHGAGFH